MGQSWKRCCITNALVGTEDDIFWESFHHGYPDLKSDLDESAESECETGCTNEEVSEQINRLNLNLQFCVDLYLFIQRTFIFLY
jgi:hypothetical protein